MGFNRDHALKVLSFWQQTEFFNTLDLKRLLPGGDDGALQYTTDELIDDPSCLPWFNRERIRSAGDAYFPNQQFAYTLYLGIFNRSEFSEQSKKYFDNEQFVEIFKQGEIEQEDWDQRREDDGITCCAKIKLNTQAELQLDSLEMSTAPWALGKLIDGKVDQLNNDDFDLDVEKFSDRLHQINALASNLKTEHKMDSAYTTYELFELLKLLSSWSGFTPTQTRFAVIIQLNRKYNDKSSPSELTLPEHVIPAFKKLPMLVKDTALVVKESDSEAGIAETSNKILPVESKTPEDMATDVPILNSFFFDDISLAIKAIKKNTLFDKSPLSQFISANVPHHADLFSAEGERLIAEKLLIKNTPLGRWPDSEVHTMSLMQQFSINTLEQHIGSGGLYSVNGPPGTGKTTMLRDIIAANIVKRAKVIARFSEANDAFLPDKKIIINDKAVVIKPLIPKLCGYEMVVVSSKPKR